jgi:DNA repair protein RadC
LDAQHSLIDYQVMFTGTLTQTSVYPREVVRAALSLNASAVILSHNHPSGDVTPSKADTALTSTLKKALDLIDVRVLDHVITCKGARALSMAEQGFQEDKGRFAE